MTVNDTQTQLNIKSVLDKIKTGKVRMKPRLYFILKSVLVIVVVILTTATSALLVSFVLFSIKESGELFLLGFGRQGLAVFISLLPWTLFVVELLLVAILKILLDQFEFGYKEPFLYMITLIALVSLGIGIFINVTPLHPTLLRHAERGELPVVGELYERLHRPPNQKGVFTGTVTAIQGNVISITYNDYDNDQDDNIDSIIVSSDIDISSLKVGDIVYVAGTIDGHTLRAYGIQLLPPIQRE